MLSSIPAFVDRWEGRWREIENDELFCFSLEARAKAAPVEKQPLGFPIGEAGRQSRTFTLKMDRFRSSKTDAPAGKTI